MRDPIALLLIGTVVAGCGGGGQTAEVDRPATTSTSDGTPTATPGVDGAAADYLELADAFNAARCEQLSGINSGDLSQAKVGQAGVAAASRVLADGLRGLQVPAHLEAARQDLSMAVAAMERTTTILSRAATVEEYNSQLEAHQENEREAGELSNFMRGELGLDSVPAEPCDG
jgi:hypothetical protein